MNGPNVAQEGGAEVREQVVVEPGICSRVAFINFICHGRDGQLLLRCGMDGW